MQSEVKPKAELYTRYPLASIVIYNGSTLLHFLLGAMVIIIGYNMSSWAGYVFGGLYTAFALIEMYVVMPLKVCPNCVYYNMENARCISGLNVVSKKIAKRGTPKDFAKRAEGLLCPNNMYLAALLIPIIAAIPALIINYSISLLVIFLSLAALMAFRFFVIFARIACLHCRAKYTCPQAGQMGVREK